jgi:two-component system chemotaxis sensor kinase CheA
VIVVADGQRSLGIMVDQIVDIVDESVTVRQAGNRPGLLGSAIVGKEVTDFLDLRAVVQTAAPEWLEHQAENRNSLVLLAEPSSFLRGVIRGELEMAGHRVVEACDALEALSRMGAAPVTAVLASTNLPPEGSSGLEHAMREQPNLAAIPVMELPVPAGSRASMLASIEQLAAAVSSKDVAGLSVSQEVADERRGN